MYVQRKHHLFPRSSSFLFNLANTKLLLVSWAPFPKPSGSALGSVQKQTLEVIRGLPTQAVSEPKGMALAFNQDRAKSKRIAE